MLWLKDVAQRWGLGDLADELGLSSSELQTRAEKTLRFMLHDYTLCSISTIDVLFHRIVRAFLLEVGLPGYYRLELEPRLALRSSAEALIEQAGDDTELTKWLGRLLEDCLQQEKSWNIEDQLTKNGREIFKEHFLTKNEQHTDASRKIRGLFDKVDREKQRFEQQLRELAARAQQLLQRHNLLVDDLKSKDTGPFSFFLKIQKGIFSRDELAKGRVRKAAAAWGEEDFSPWATKDSKHTEEIKAALEDGLGAALTEGVELLESADGIRYASISALRPQMYFQGLITHMQQQIRRYRDEEGIVFLSDINQILRQLISESHTPYIYEKVGSYYQHYLLDEFQDTSLFQWEILSPLLRDGLDQGYEQLLVGDLKQSIYRWRGAAPMKLLKAFRKDIPEALYKEKRLTQNYRSAPQLVELNNALFQAAAQQLCRLFPNEASASSPLSMSYASIELGAKKKIPGYATFTARSRAAGSEPTFQWLYTQLDDLFARGYRPDQICILVRTHREEEEIVKQLTQHAAASDRFYTIYSRRSTRLANAPAVQLLVVALSLFEVPREVLYSEDQKLLWLQIYALLQRLDAPNEPHTHHAFETFWTQLKAFQLKGAVSEFQRSIESLRRAPLYMLFERLLTIFQLYTYASERPFLDDFMAWVLSYQAKYGSSRRAFLEEWTARADEACLSASPTSKALQLMTLHQIKGLEFPVVLLPFCSWSLDHSSSEPKYLCKQAPKEGFFSDFPFLFLRYGKPLMHTEFEAYYQSERLATYLDNLNLLYVACTRSIQELHACYEIKKKKAFDTPSSITDPENVGELLHSILFAEDQLLLPDFERKISEDQAVGYYGAKIQSSDLSHKPQPKDKSVTQVPLTEERLLDRSDWSEYILISSPSEETPSARIQGNLFHQQIAEIDCLSDLDSVLSKLGDSDDEQWVAHRLRALFALPQVKDWFSGRWQLKHEQNILTTEGRWCRPDLILLSETEVQVVDFKRSPFREALHIQQLRDYITLVSRISKQEISGFLAYIEPLQIVRVQ